MFIPLKMVFIDPYRYPYNLIKKKKHLAGCDWLVPSTVRIPQRLHLFS